MKFKLLLSSFFIAIFLPGFSQLSTRAFAITGQGNGNFNWTDIREIDMSSGNTNATLFENGKTKFSFLDADTKKPVDQIIIQNTPAATGQNSIAVSPKILVSSDKIVIANPSPTLLMSAAAAYDKKHDKLFFASMRTGQLVWLDLRNANGTPSFYTIQKPLVSNIDYNDESFNITRMTIGSDGNGYALTNDANHLIRFTTGNKIVISDLGNIVDAESNNGISVHNKCSSWGGDMVADAFGKLYLLSAGRNVFVIDPETRVATYKGTISNLSPSFTVNGAAVVDDDNVIVSSANTFEGFYKVNMKDLTSTKLVTKGQIYNASDLASSNLLHQSERQNSVGVPVLNNIEVTGNKYITIYPNPVSSGQVKITFETHAGKYRVALTDLQGRVIETEDVYTKAMGQIVNYKFQTKQASGMYLIKITDDANKIIYGDKLVIE